MTVDSDKPGISSARESGVRPVRARRILSTGAFDPSDMDRLQSAFDAAWTVIEPTAADEDHDRLRSMLATIIVASGNVSGLDKDELAAIALRTFSAIRESETN